MITLAKVVTMLVYIIFSGINMVEKCLRCLEADTFLSWIVYRMKMSILEQPMITYLS